jgi:Phosphoribosylcarboxyaminoimidazole (NCAIR) mutase
LEYRIGLKYFDGLDSMLSIVQMPNGIPVATVASDAARNAALLAIRILATTDSELAKQLSDYQESMRETVRGKNLDWS